MTALCPPKLAPLACRMSGHGWLRCAWNHGVERITLEEGQGSNFPEPIDGQVFWIDVGDHTCGGCIRLKVTRREGDDLIVETPNHVVASSVCGAPVRYAETSIEHMLTVALSVGISAVSPLRFDCESRKLWIDCEALKDMLDRPCGT